MAVDGSLRKRLPILLLFFTTTTDVRCQTTRSSFTSPVVSANLISAPASPLLTTSSSTGTQVTTTPTVSLTASAATALQTTATQSISVTLSAASQTAQNVNSSSSSLTSSSASQTVKADSETTTPSASAAALAANMSASDGSSVALTTDKPKDCQEQLMQVDGCIKRIVLIGDREAVIPKTVMELEDKHCNRIKGELICVREYGRVCLKLFPRTIFTIVRKNVEKVFKSFCTNADGKAMAVKYLGCFKPGNLMVLHAVVDKVTHTLQYIERNITDVQIIPYMCCAFYTFYRETQMIVDSMCLNSTGPGTSEFVINIIKAIVTDALDLGCGQYGSYKKCTDNLPDGVRVFTQIFQHDKYSNSTYAVPPFSPVIPMIAISKRLDSGF